MPPKKPTASPKGKVPIKKDKPAPRPGRSRLDVVSADREGLDRAGQDRIEKLLELKCCEGLEHKGLDSDQGRKGRDRTVRGREKNRSPDESLDLGNSKKLNEFPTIQDIYSAIKEKDFEHAIGLFKLVNSKTVFTVVITVLVVWMFLPSQHYVDYGKLTQMILESEEFKSIIKDQWCDNQCPPGEPGPPGVSGPQGVQGPVGLQGKTGEQAFTGLTGEPGTTGPQGDQGGTGEKGESGASGHPGVQGPVGPQGRTGEQGLTGLSGEQGKTGPQGDQGGTGEPGEKGASGPLGERGPFGPEGPKGEQGAVGWKGEQGDVGSKGDQGAAGLKGEQGYVGLKGEQGAMGLKGDAGPARLMHTQQMGGWTLDEVAGGQGPIIWNVSMLFLLLGVYLYLSRRIKHLDSRKIDSSAFITQTSTTNQSQAPHSPTPDTCASSPGTPLTPWQSPTCDTPDHKTPGWSTPVCHTSRHNTLHNACDCEQEDEAEVKRLLESDAKLVQLLNADNNSPLHLAVRNKHINIIKLLLTWNPPITSHLLSQVDEDGCTAIEIAARSSLPIVKYIIAELGDMSWKNYQMNLIYSAILNGDENMLSFLKSQGAEYSGESTFPDSNLNFLFRAVRDKKANVVRFIMNHDDLKPDNSIVIAALRTAYNFLAEAQTTDKRKQIKTIIDILEEQTTFSLEHNVES